MWFDILKNLQAATQTSGSFDFEEEAIPEKDEPNCKEKLIAIQQALANWRPAGTKYKGAIHKRGTDSMTTLLYQDGKDTESTKRYDWLQNGKKVGLTITSDSQTIRNVTEEQACEILEDLEKIVDKEPKQWWDGKHLSAKYFKDALSLIDMNVSDKGLSRVFIYFMSINGKEADFWIVDIGHQDESFAQELFNQAKDYLRQQVK